MSDGVVGGVSSRPLANGQAQLQYPDLLSASTAIIQAGGGGFARLKDALQLLDQSGNVLSIANSVTVLQGQVATLQGEVATIQGQIATLQGQVTTINGEITTINATLTSLQNQINVINTRLANAGIP